MEAEQEPYQAELDTLFTGSDNEVVAVIGLAPGVELIKRYVYPYGSWKAEDGQLVTASRARSEQVHEVLLSWVGMPHNPPPNQR